MSQSARIIQICLTAMLCFGSGCSFVQSPKATVTQVSLADTSEQGARVTFTVELENPNGVALPMTQSRYTMTLPDGSRYSATAIPCATMPRRAGQTVTLAGAFDIPGQNLAGKTMQITGSIEYEPPGQIRRIFTDSGVPLPRTTFSYRGPVQ